MRYFKKYKYKFCTEQNKIEGTNRTKLKELPEYKFCTEQNKIEGTTRI